MLENLDKAWELLILFFDYIQDFLNWDSKWAHLELLLEGQRNRDGWTTQEIDAARTTKMYSLELALTCMHVCWRARNYIDHGYVAGNISNMDNSDEIRVCIVLTMPPNQPTLKPNEPAQHVTYSLSLKGQACTVSTTACGKEKNTYWEPLIQGYLLLVGPIQVSRKVVDNITKSVILTLTRGFYTACSSYL